MRTGGEPPPVYLVRAHLVVLPGPQCDASFGYLHWVVPLMALVGPQRDASSGYLCWSLPLVAWGDPQRDASFGYLRWVSLVRARWVRAWALPLLAPVNFSQLVFSLGLGWLYAVALMCYSSMLLRAISPSARSLWRSHFAGRCSEASRSVFSTLAILEWRSGLDPPLALGVCGDRGSISPPALDMCGDPGAG